MPMNTTAGAAATPLGAPATPGAPRSRDYPHIVTPPPGPRARTVVERDEAWTSPCYIKEYPLVVERGRGAMVEDVDGNRYLDFMAGIAVTSTGHSHPAVVQAIKDAADRFLHICGSDFYYEEMAALCERLATLAPGPSRKRVFLTNSGTEAVDGAIKLVRNSTRRPALIAFEGAFHGRSYGAMSLTASKARQRGGFAPLVPEVFHVPYPAPYRDGAAALQRTMDALDALLARRLDPRDVAGIFVEPVQGEGGYVVPPAGFLSALRELCDRHGILLGCDEVQCGVGRTGRLFACEHDGVEPDVLLTAKGLGSGMPIGAIVSREEVTLWERGSHGSTFGGNPVCCAAALATLGLVVEGGLSANAGRMGDRLLAGLRDLAERHPSVGDVRGLGLMIGVELVADRATREPAPGLVHALVQRAFERGLLLLGAGRSTLRIAPPLVIDEYDVDTALDMIDDCLGALSAE